MVLDAETAAMIEVAQRMAPTLLLRQTGLVTLGTNVPLRPEIETFLRGRLEMIRTGLERVPGWFRKKLERFDPNLRLRWDFQHQYWLVEHFSSLDGLFHICGSWDGALGDRLIEELRKSDMRKKTPDEHIAEEHTRNDIAQRSNDHNVNESLGEAIDNMSNKQVREFVEASHAICHGEEVIPMGDDAKFMERLQREHQQWLAEQEKKKNAILIP